MKAVILAGGMGTRLGEETDIKPKPMVEIGGFPILWHIMKIYSAHGINEFIICLGYKGYAIKEYFSNYFLHKSDVTFSMADNSMEVHDTAAEPWKVTLVDTGDRTMTGGRVKRVRSYLNQDETFCLTYGDGVGDVDIKKLIKHHEDSNCLATVTAVYPPGRFGALQVDGNKVMKFEEKPTGDGSRINGGFFVLSAKVMEMIEGDKTIWEREPLMNLAKQGQLSAFNHDGFWQPMDTLREKRMLEELWNSGNPPWKIW